MAAIRGYERPLAERLVSGLASIAGVTIYGITDPACFDQRAPAVYPVLPVDTRKAIELFREYAPLGVKARDVLHAAVMKNNGLVQIISTDHHYL